jgi:hypothetical protein
MVHTVILIFNSIYDRIISKQRMNMCCIVQESLEDNNHNAIVLALH